MRFCWFFALWCLYYYVVFPNNKLARYWFDIVEVKDQISKIESISISIVSVHVSFVLGLILSVILAEISNVWSFIMPLTTILAMLFVAVYGLAVLRHIRKMDENLFFNKMREEPKRQAFNNDDKNGYGCQ